MTIRITHNDPQKLAHIAWCALVALGIARKDKKVPKKNRVAANKFIGNWAGRAALDGRFGPQYRDELSIWESNGVKNAMISNVEASLEEVLDKYAGKVAHAKKFPASYKRRIHNAGCALRTLNWTVKIGLLRDWENEGAYSPDCDHTAFIMKEHMDEFDNIGRLANPISLMVISNDVQKLVDAFYDAGILLFQRSTNKHNGKCQYVFEIHPDNNGKGLTNMAPTEAKS